MPYMVTFTINIPQMLAYIPYMDPMGNRKHPPAIFRLWCDFSGSQPGLEEKSRNQQVGARAICLSMRLCVYIYPLVN